jgi:hypothetical protein
LGTWVSKPFFHARFSVPMFGRVEKQSCVAIAQPSLANCFYACAA